MVFNSIDFAIFLPIVFILYWFVFKNLKAQNILIVIASYVFYGWWDWRFLFLIAFSTLVDYAVGIYLEREKNASKRKLLLILSITVNLGLLGFFKYYNFFVDNFVASFSFLGMNISKSSLDIILPVGISFYTFQTLSYSIDIYRRKLPATNSILEFTAFVSFFPQLVAGPIERATNLLPQFQKIRVFNYGNAVEGLRQILWGLFKKIVIADNCAKYANMAFNNYEDYSGSTLLLGAVFFTFQIYGDFSGYSDIAIGTSRLFGFKLEQNFAFPYFSRNIAEFWRRWHISLSTWFRDYLYIPLGGSKGTTFKKVRNVFIIFLVSGFWHGANWTFIVWGGLNALYFLPNMLLNKNRTYIDTIASNTMMPSLREIISVGTTFSLTVIAWVFFRAENVSHALMYLAKIFSSSLFVIPEFRPKNLIILIVVFMAIEWLGRKQEFAISKPHLSKITQWLFYYILVYIIYFYGQFGENIEFIYFQF